VNKKGAARLQQTRQALIAATGQLLARGGLKALTMSAVADQAKLARATVYNHVRDRDELLTMYLDHQRQQVRSLALSHATPLAGLTALAHWVAQDAAIAGVRQSHPEALIDLQTYISAMDEGIALDAMDVLRAWNVHADIVVAETVLRWLCSYMWVPALALERETSADVIAAMLQADSQR
jgi:AcrR family transcriptional regulator